MIHDEKVYLIVVVCLAEGLKTEQRANHQRETVD